MSDTKVRTGRVMLAYPRLFEPKPDLQGRLKYGVQILIPKSDTQTHAAILKAFDAAARMKFGANASHANLPHTLRDGDQEQKTPAHVGHWFMNLNSDQKPGVVVQSETGLRKYDSFADETIRSGDWGRVTLNCYGYSAGGNKGLSAGLHNVLWIGDSGTTIGGGAAAPESDFADGWGDTPAAATGTDGPGF